MVSGIRIVVGVVVGLFLWIGALGVTGRVESQFYYPDRLDYGTPAAAGLAFEDVFFESEDGVRLHGWFVPAVGAPTGTVVHFHGNAQNLSAHFAFVDWLPRRGFHVFAFDYRGYGRSEGRPSREGLIRDGRAAIETVRRRTEVDPDRIVVFGQSLGAASALAVVALHPELGVRAVAADSAFFSYRTIVRDKIRELPVIGWFAAPLSRWLITDDWSPGLLVDRIAPVPVLLIHGERDRVIPVHHARMLHAVAREPKMLYCIPGFDHTEALVTSDGRWRDTLVRFFLEALDRPAEAVRAASRW